MNIQYSVNEGKVGNLSDQVQKVYNIYPHLQYGTFLANHDQNRILNSFNNDESKVKLAASIYLTLPGVPYLYYGEEIGMSGVKPDENIRRPMQWDNSLHAGFTTGNPWRAVHGGFNKFNVANEANDPNSLLSTYKQLIHLRNQEKALQIGTYEALNSDENKVYAFLRQHEGEEVIVIHNMGTSVVRDIELSWEHASLANGNRVLIDLMADASSMPVNIDNQRLRIPLTLAGRGTKVFKFSQTTVSTQQVITSTDIEVYPNPVNSNLFVKALTPKKGIMTYQIFDVQGKMVQGGQVDLQNLNAIIPTQHLNTGWYQLLFLNEDGAERVSFIKQ